MIDFCDRFMEWLSREPMAVRASSRCVVETGLLQLGNRRSDSRSKYRAVDKMVG
jgi:hypothetical protein